MTAVLNPYLSFRGNAREAMDFYKQVFDGEVTSMTFGEQGDAARPADGIMHSELRAANGIVFMASDTPEEMPYTPGSSISMSLSGDSHADLRRYFERLSEGGQVGQQLTEAPWGDTFGMITDRYGVTWLVNI
jgi:PhnB protein